MKDELYERLAELYDVLYGNKDYEKEVEFLDKIFREYGERVSSILDVGCGTGKHAELLYERGYDVVGIDLSEEMIEIAKKRLKNKATFMVGDMRNFDLGKKFDAVICMFSTFLYNTTTDDILKSLRNFHNHLKDDGLVVLHFFYPVKFSDKWKTEYAHSDYKVIEETVVEEHDALNQIIKRKTTYTLIKNGKKQIFKPQRAPLRYIMPQEIKCYLERTGFEVIKMFNGFDKNKKKEGELVVVGRKYER